MDPALDSNGAEDPTPAPSQPEAERKTYIVGIGLLGIVVLLWTASNFIIQHLLEAGYDKPFMLTYLSTCSFSLYLVPYIITERHEVFKWLTSSRKLRGVDREAYQPLPTDAPVAELSPLRPTRTPSQPPAPEERPLTTRETAQLAVIFSALWLLANWAVNASLGYTSVASTTILTSTSGFFTLGVGALARVEKFTLLKVGAVSITFAGVALVSLSDSQSTPDAVHARPGALWGDTLALGSAVLYALYVVLLKVGIRSESRIDMRLFFGFLGSATLLLYWPLALLLHFAGIETLAWPATRGEWAAVGVNSLITFTSDFLYLIAMLKTTPLVVTIGLSMTIPAALAGDFLLGRPSTVRALLGALLVLGGFAVVGVEDGKKEQREPERAPPE